MITLPRAASARHLLRHPGQLALALAGLATGVATIVAVDIAVGSARRAFELSLDAVNGAATHRIVAGPEGIDEQLFVRLRRAGVTGAAPIIEGYVSVGDRALQLIGIDPLSRVSVTVAERDVTALARTLTEEGAAWLTARTADELGIALDEPFEVTIAGRVHPAVLVGHLGEAQHDLIVTDIAQAQEWLALDGRISRIELAAAPPAELLPPGVLVEGTARASKQSVDLSSAFTTNLQAMSLLALLVGALLVYSAVSFAVVQRRGTLGTLRALGVTPRQVLTSVLGEAAVLGIAGAAIGVAVGVPIGRELIGLVSRTINDLYFVVSVRDVVLPTAAVVKAFVIGVVTALVAGALPAAEVAHSPPQLGIRRSVIEARAGSGARSLAIASVILAAASGIVVLASGRSLLGGFAALSLLLGAAAAATPAVLRLLARRAARMAGGVSPIGGLALGDVAASLSRTGVAVAALGVALAAMIGVAVMVESFRESLRDWLGRTLRADVYVTSPGPGFARPERRLEPEVVRALRGTPGVAGHSASRRVSVPSPRGPVYLDALDLAPQGRAGVQLTARDRETVWRKFDEGGLISSDSLAWRLDLEPGDVLEVTTPGGVRAFPIAGIYREYGNDRGSAMIQRDVYRRIWRDDAVTSLGLYLDAGAEPTEIIPRLRAAVGDAQSLHFRSRADLRDLSMRIFERTFVITRVLYWLAAGVAAIGLLSALLAWQLERARELALLRALGVTPGGAAALIGGQTAFMTLVALLAAIPAGLATAVMLIDVINRRAFGWQIDLHVPAAPFVDALALATAAAIAAALYPAWRAARAPLAAVMREE